MRRSKSIFLTVKKKVIDCRWNGLCRKGYIKYLCRTAELSDGIVMVEFAKSVPWKKEKKSTKVIKNVGRRGLPTLKIHWSMCYEGKSLKNHII